MNTDLKPGDHLNLLKQEPGPTIVGQIITDNDEKVSVLTPFGIYEISKNDVAKVVSDAENDSQVTITKGAKILFSKLIDAESLLPRNRASLAHVAQGAKQLQLALNRVLGKTEIPSQPIAVQTADCPMSECSDCCECPVVDGDNSEAPSRSQARMEYYERQIGRGLEQDYRKEE